MRSFDTRIITDCDNHFYRFWDRLSHDRGGGAPGAIGSTQGMSVEIVR
jgi:hypothetical protein